MAAPNADAIFSTACETASMRHASESARSATGLSGACAQLRAVAELVHARETSQKYLQEVERAAPQ